VADQHAALVIRWFDEIWNQGRLETVDELLTPESILHEGDLISKGPEEFRQFYHRMHSAFSEIRVTTEAVVCQGDLACVRWSVSMRHSGDGLGMPATGKVVRATGMGMIRIENGKFVEAWQNWDMLGIMQQIEEQAPAPTYVAFKAASAV
jgi:steroid delta-isomerase-like uncharacterized protein